MLNTRLEARRLCQPGVVVCGSFKSMKSCSHLSIILTVPRHRIPLWKVPRSKGGGFNIQNRQSRRCVLERGGFNIQHRQSKLPVWEHRREVSACSIFAVNKRLCIILIWIHRAELSLFATYLRDGGSFNSSFLCNSFPNLTVKSYEDW